MDKNAWMNLLKHGTHSKSNNPMFNISVNGKQYLNPHEMPEETKQQLKEMFGNLEDENHDGVPDMFEGGIINFLRGLSQLRPSAILKNQAQQFSKKIDQQSANAPNKKVIQGQIHSSAVRPTTFKEDRAERFKVLLIVLVVLGVAVALGWEWIVEFVERMGLI